MTATFIIYYSVVALFLLMYLKHRLRTTVSICDIVLITSCILCIAGGYYSSYGYAIGSENVFNPTIYICYILFMVITVVGFLSGKRVRLSSIEKINLDVKVSSKTIWVLYAIIGVYAFAFFVFIRDNIPLIKLLLTGASASEAAISRLQVTHNIVSSYSLPFIFRYRKLITETPLDLLLCLSFCKFLLNKKEKVLFFFILVTTFFCRTFALEKAGIIDIVLLLSITYILVMNSKYQSQDKRRLSSKIKRRIMYALILGTVLVIGMYWLFMGQNSMNIIISSIINRIFLRQTGYIYYHDIALNDLYNGCLYGKGIPIFLIDNIIGRTPVSLSGEVYRYIYSAYSQFGYVGTTGTMVTYFFYSNFGYVIGISIYFVLCFITAVLDGSMAKKVIKSEVEPSLSIAVYATLMLLFYKGFISNLTIVYQLPFFFSPQIIILFVCVCFLKSIKVV